MKGVKLHCTWIGKIMAGTVYSTLFFMFTFTCITEKELKRVIDTKGDESRRKENSKVKMSGSRSRDTLPAAVKNKSEHEHGKQNIG